MQPASHNVSPADDIRVRRVIDPTTTSREVLPSFTTHAPAAAAMQDRLVGEIMARDVICVRAELSVETLLSVLLERRIGGTPVVNNHAQAVGMVSKTDLLRDRFANDTTVEERPLSEREERSLRSRFGPGYHLHTIARSIVADVMMPIAMTIAPTDTVGRAATLMAYEGVHRLPVVAEHGEVIGVITPMDILRVVADAASPRPE